MDDFPRTRDQWMVMIDKNLLTDDVICLKDGSENGDFLIRRWYKLNKESVDQQIAERKEKESQEKARQEEEAK